MNGHSLKSYLENFPPIFVQRASNLENSTYDLYTIPKDADSQNPDGKHFLISHYSSERLLLYSCLLLLLLSPTVCVLYIKKLHFCKPPIGFFFLHVSQCPCSTHHLAGFLLTISHDTDLKNSCSSQTFTATNIYFIILLLVTFHFPFRRSRQHSWLVNRDGF